MIQSQQGKLWRAPDLVPLFYRCFPGHKTDYYFSIIHGFAEHSGRYAKLIECLQRTGRTVLVYDLRGHGGSGGERGAVKSWEQYWDDFCGLTRYLKNHSEVPTSRTIIVGHSLGGLIALEGALRDGKNVSGLILSSPCMGVPLAPALKLLNYVLAYFFPRFSYSRPVKPEDLSRDEEACQAYANDPLILKRMPAKTLQAMINAGNSLVNTELKLCMPIWFLVAGNERVVDLNRTLMIYAKLKAPFKKLKVFEAFRHEIFNEVCNEIAYDTALLAFEQIVEFNSKSGQSIS